MSCLIAISAAVWAPYPAISSCSVSSLISVSTAVITLLYSDEAALRFVPLPGDLPPEFEHLAHVQAALQAIGPVSFSPDEDISGEATLHLPDLARRRAPHQDVFSALEPEAERADRCRLDARAGSSELLRQPHLVALQLREEHGRPAVVEDRRDQSGMCVEAPRLRCVQDQWYASDLLGFAQRERVSEPGDEGALLRVRQRLDAFDRDRPDVEEAEDRAARGRHGQCDPEGDEECDGEYGHASATRPPFDPRSDA